MKFPAFPKIPRFYRDVVISEKIDGTNASYFIDPYVVHRRPLLPAGTRRKFVRLSFVPIEIEDDTCMHNPMLPAKHYGRSDIRKTLVRYGE